MPEISVIIPSYNHDAYILRAVSSVLSQTFTDLELIVVDDGSTDNTMKTLLSVNDPRLKIISQENQGAHSAVNHGLRVATGKYLSILNSDDYYHPERLEIMAAALEQNQNIGLVSSYIEIVDEFNQPIGIKHGYQDCEPWLLDHPELSFRVLDDSKEAILTENYLASTSNFFFSRHWCEKVGEFRPLRFTNDWDFALRMQKMADLEMIKTPLLFYRVHPDNTIRSDHTLMIYEICWILAVHLPGYISGSSFFKGVPTETLVERLLHSIYTYNCDRVLSVMLLQSLYENEAHALALLEPENSERKKYLAYIQKSICASSDRQKISPSPAPISWLKTLISRYLQWRRS